MAEVRAGVVGFASTFGEAGTDTRVHPSTPAFWVAVIWVAAALLLLSLFGIRR